jgi:arylsulfatase A-like enzyme/Flp pilus assembly protein TadD
MRALGATLLLAAAACAQAPKPSILLVTIDTLRADRVGCYGYANARTPTLDHLARDGVRFEEARSHVPLTAPAHATILTGVLPPRHGVRGNGAFPLNPDAPALAEALKRSGYRTAAVVGSVVLDRATGLDRGFESYDDNQRRGPKSAFAYLERGGTQIEESARNALDRLEPPFFLWVHFYDPHMPWVSPTGEGYDCEIAFADAALGHVIDAARKRAGEHLVIAVTSDHGESLGEHGENQHGYTLHRGVLRVPLVVAGPEIPPGRTVAETVGLVDLAPTLAEIAAVDLPGTTGRSLAPLWQGRTRANTGELWEETLHPLFDSGWAPLRGLLGSRWHFVDAPRPELYERASDPDDRNDIAASNGPTVAELQERLRALGASMGDTDDPKSGESDAEQRQRLAALGYVSVPARPAPAGGRLDPKDGLPGFLAVEEAERLIELGDAAKAKALVEPHLARDPGNPRLWHTLAKARLRLRDVNGARDAIAKSLDLAPGLEFLRTTHAEILSAAGDEKAAGAELEAILRDNPRAVDASLQLSAMAIRRNDPAASEKILLAAFQAGARDPDLLDRLGQLMLRNGREREAREYFAQALALWPDDPVALLALGQSDLSAGDPASAIRHLARCADEPTAFECRIELARAYVVGPRDLDAARNRLLEARGLAKDARIRDEVDKRLAALEAMR